MNGMQQVENASHKNKKFDDLNNNVIEQIYQ